MIMLYFYYQLLLFSTPRNSHHTAFTAILTLKQNTKETPYEKSIVHINCYATYCLFDSLW